MKLSWQNKNNHPSLIIFFTGWGMKPASTGHLKPCNHDLLVVSDYTTLDFPDVNKIKKYTEVTVVGWSMGVMVASYLMSENILRPAQCIAINGTAKPVSDELGIPSAIYKSTIDALSEHSLKKFLLRMCGSKSQFDLFMKQHTLSDINELKQELVAIEGHQKKVIPPMWDVAILCKKDLIFSFENMERFWAESARKRIVTEDAHYPFYQWETWGELIDFCKQ